MADGGDYIIDIKCAAILKLIYLEMFGHSMSWASFHVLEVMSSQRFVQKRVGYLAAVQSFRLDTDVLMLATNLLKKVGGPNYFLLDRGTLETNDRIGSLVAKPVRVIFSYKRVITYRISIFSERFDAGPDSENEPFQPLYSKKGGIGYV